MARIDAFLKLGTTQGCSDLHLAVGVPPMLRMHGDLVPINFRELGEAELEGYVHEVLTQSQIAHLKTGKDLDFSYVSTDGGRFRANVFRKETGIGAVFRTIPTQIPSIEQLNLPPIVRKLCDYHQGMILVTGATGTGKSTTLAAMIDHLNTTRALNIISLEDPIEFVHRSKASQVIQRELGTHLPSFAEGVRAAMREDPDVILVGEMRDAETISMAMTAAETGHLVLATMHSPNVSHALERIIGVFDGSAQKQIILQLSNALQGIIAQDLLPSADRTRRVLAYELLVATGAVRNLIRENQLHHLENTLQMGRKEGMVLMDNHLYDLYCKCAITYDTALSRARHPDRITRQKT